MPSSVYLFLGFTSGRGMGGIFDLFPLVEKSDFLIEISVNSGIFSSLPLGGNQVLSYVTPPHLLALPRPPPSDVTPQLRPVAGERFHTQHGTGRICTVLAPMGDTQVCQTKVSPARIGYRIFRAQC